MSFGRTQEELAEINQRWRRDTREKARAAASNTGVRPDQKLEPEALADAFRGVEHEIAELNEIAARCQARQVIDQHQSQRRARLRGLADTVEREWKAQARAAAEAEAARRLAETEPPAAPSDIEALTAQILAQADEHARVHGR